jgi:hypothetical protein
MKNISKPPQAFKKASEIFLKYVEPLMNEVNPNHSAEHLQQTLRFPEMIWNSVVMQTWDLNKPDYIQAMRDQFKNTPPEQQKFSNAMIDMWIKRKQDLFPDIKWAFEINVRQGKEGPVIRAFVRVPDHLKHTVPAEWQFGKVRQIDFQS